MSTHAQGVGQEPYDRWLMYRVYSHIFVVRIVGRSQRVVVAGKKKQKSKKKLNLKKMAVISFCWLAMVVVLVVTNRIQMDRRTCCLAGEVDELLSRRASVWWHVKARLGVSWFPVSAICLCTDVAVACPAGLYGRDFGVVLGRKPRLSLLRSKATRSLLTGG